MQHRYLLLIFLISAVLPLTAQVRGLSYTLSPVANYNFFEKESGLQDGILAGGRVGIGFGEFIELRGNYLFDLGLKTDPGNIALLQGVDLPERDINLTRYGGEIKLNIGRGKFLPFLTVGTGIQTLELDGGAENEQIYASGGLGIVLSLADRFNFTIEGKHTAFNQDPARGLLTQDDRDAAGITDLDFDDERQSNWSLGAGLTLYLGGRRPGQLSEVDEAYQRAFSGGFKGASILVEPSLSHINFNSDLAYRDTWLGGAAVGLNFGPLVGFRAFYLRAMEDDKINLDFDPLSVYGGDFRFRLSNRQTGFAPFLILGGGYLDSGSDYVPRDGVDRPSDQAFAAGGGGVALNLGRTIRITASYKALLTTGRQVENLEDTDQIRRSDQISFGLNLAFGAKAQRPQAVFAAEADARVQRQRNLDAFETQQALNEQARRNAEATTELKENYEERIAEIERDLEIARLRRDTVNRDSMQRTVAQLREVVSELEAREAENNRQLNKAVADSTRLVAIVKQDMNRDSLPVALRNSAPASAPASASAVRSSAATTNNQSRIVLSPAEFEGLIEEIFEGLNYGMPAGSYAPLPPPGTEMEIEREMRVTTADTARMNSLERQLNALQQSVADLQARQDSADRERATDEQALREEMQQNTRQILDELRKIRSEMPAPTPPTDREIRQREREERRQGNGN